MPPTCTQQTTQKRDACKSKIHAHVQAPQGPTESPTCVKAAKPKKGAKFVLFETNFDNCILKKIRHFITPFYVHIPSFSLPFFWKVLGGL